MRRCVQRYALSRVNTLRLRSFSEFVDRLNSWTVKYRDNINRCIQHVEMNEKFSLDISQLMPLPNWHRFLGEYRRKLVKSPKSLLSDPDILKLQQYLDKISDSRLDGTVHAPDRHRIPETLEESCRFIFENAKETVKRDFESLILANDELRNVSDIRLPHEWYPRARIMKRRIIYHGGPTNSGKVLFCSLDVVSNR